MFRGIRRKEVLIKALKGTIIDLPAPLKVNYMWNFGSIIGIYLTFQILRGVFLSMHYIPSISHAFDRVNTIMRDIDWGWFIRLLHIAGSSGFFFFIFLHIGRGVYYKVYRKIHTWLTGVTILLLSMATRFFGYVLPWGQMSYWGATVITNFLTVLPYIGRSLVLWVWGRFSVDYPTLTRFFRLHFLVPFIIVFFVVVHIVYLHQNGSNKPLRFSRDGDKIPFYLYYMYKDILGFWWSFLLIYWFFFLSPERFVEYQNFIKANYLVTPTHIQPEWYFLSAYAVLRAIPKKLGGVVALVLFIVVFYFLPLILKKFSIPINYCWFMKFIFWYWALKYVMLTWVGSCPVEYPFDMLCQVGMLYYFGFFICLGIIHQTLI
jgi:ubiquinol-cytochrome c reductase cytochrome b subunit